LLLYIIRKSKSRTQAWRRRSWKWWFWLQAKNVFLWLKRLWCNKSYVLRSRFGLLNLIYRNHNKEENTKILTMFLDFPEVIPVIMLSKMS